MSPLSPTYAELFDRAQNPRHREALEAPTRSISGANYACGDEVKLDLAISSDGRIERCAHQCQACAVTTAAADILAEIVTGKTVTEVVALDPEEFLSILGADLAASRQVCATLPLRTLQQQLQSDRHPLE